MMPGPERGFVEAVEASNLDKASMLFREAVGRGENALKIQDSLFPMAQRVLSPSFINPHLPKMHHALLHNHLNTNRQ